ncbi:MAG TPA: hypothetical protein VI585_00515 [Candidatus Binatia bacterium]
MSKRNLTTNIVNRVIVLAELPLDVLEKIAFELSNAEKALPDLLKTKLPQ